MHVAQNWPKLGKRPPFLQFSSKLSDFFYWWKIWQIEFFFIWSAFGSLFFWLGCWHQTAFTKKINLRSFHQNWRNTSHIRTRWIESAPPHDLGLKKIVNYRTHAIITRSWLGSALLTIYKDRIFKKSPWKQRNDLQNGVLNIQAVGYNGMHTVCHFMMTKLRYPRSKWIIINESMYIVSYC